MNVHCNVTKNGLKAKAIWYPPEYPYGLIVKYIVRYKHLVSSPRKTNWKIGTVTMEPNSKGYPLIYDLDADYYKKYRIEVSAVNGAGEGPAAVVKSCALRRMPTGMYAARKITNLSVELTAFVYVILGEKMVN